MLETVGIFGQHSKAPAAAAAPTQRGSETERTVFSGDAVFAIAMTLLALDLKLPSWQL